MAYSIETTAKQEARRKLTLAGKILSTHQYFSYNFQPVVIYLLFGLWSLNLG
jgi:hypothetical protein